MTSLQRGGGFVPGIIPPTSDSQYVLRNDIRSSNFVFIMVLPGAVVCTSTLACSMHRSVNRSHSGRPPQLRTPWISTTAYDVLIETAYVSITLYPYESAVTRSHVQLQADSPAALDRELNSVPLCGVPRTAYIRQRIWHRGAICDNVALPLIYTPGQ